MKAPLVLLRIVRGTPRTDSLGSLASAPSFNSETMPTSQDKWTAALMSLAAPGAGQLWAGKLSAIGWLACVAMVLAVGASLRAPAAVTTLCLAAVSLLSAEHAKRGLERQPSWRRSAAVVSRQYWRRPRGRGVRFGFELSIALPAEVVWRRVAELPTFLCVDPFHTRVAFLTSARAAGAELAIEHRAPGFRNVRFGRVLRWREGEGFAFSDLSRLGKNRGFPHVFHVSVQPNGSRDCRLRIDVRGKWTARRLPLTLGQWWLRYVAWEHARLLRKAM